MTTKGEGWKSRSKNFISHFYYKHIEKKLTKMGSDAVDNLTAVLHAKGDLRLVSEIF